MLREQFDSGQGHQRIIFLEKYSRGVITARLNPQVSGAGDAEVGNRHALLDHLVDAEEDQLGDHQPECLRRFRLITSSTFVDHSTGRSGPPALDRDDQVIVNGWAWRSLCGSC